jgi:glucan phosphoethanolaminetransferase (alkaline phosphatase superfamily)
MKWFDKINISQIIKNHFDTLKNSNTDKADSDDYFTFLIVPIAITLVLLYFKIFLSDGVINIIVMTLAILVGLLFNVIVLVFDILQRDPTKTVKNTILRELLSNISYTILLSIFAIILTLFTFCNNNICKYIFNGLVYFVLVSFTFTILMILKRIHKLFKNEIDEAEKKGYRNNVNKADEILNQKNYECPD